MPYFDQIYRAAKNRDAKTIAQLLLQGAEVDEIQGIALTPAGKCLQEGDNATFFWLYDNFQASLDKATYGGIKSGAIPVILKEEMLLSGPSGKGITITYGHTVYSAAFVCGENANVEQAKFILDSIGDNINLDSSRLAKNIVHGAYFDNNQEFMSEIFEYCKELYSKPIVDKLIYSLISLEASIGNREILDDRLKDNPSKESYYLGAAIRGAAMANQPILLTHLRKQPSYGLALRAAAESQKEELFFKLLAEYPEKLEGINDLEIRAKSQAIEFAAMYGRFSWLNKLLIDDGDYKDAAIGCGKWCESYYGVLSILINFDDIDKIEKLAAAIVMKEVVDQDLMADIKKNAFKILKLKQMYHLHPMEAKALYSCKELIPLMVDQDYKSTSLRMMLHDKVKDVLHPSLLENVIENVRKNAPKAQLIKELKRYPGTVGSFSKNHTKRARDFLERVAHSKSLYELKAMVSRQHSFFSTSSVPLSPGAQAISEEKAHPSTLKPKNPDVHDAYTKAIENCYIVLK